MNRTQIEWVKNPDGSQGYTWNPTTGCLNHDNGLCNGGGFPCYAYKLAHGRLKPLYLNNLNVGEYPDREIETLAQDQHPFYPRFWEERLLQPAKGLPAYLRTKPKGIFVCDMGDLFGIGVPEEWTRRVLEQCKTFSQHRFYLLTKQPQNLVKFSPFPDNCWVGVTITNEATLLKATTNLGYIDAKVKYISFEPLLERLPLPYYQMNCDWLIIGACTGNASSIGALIRRYPDLDHKPLGNLWTAQPNIAWVREIVEAADQAGIPVFLKDNLKPLLPPEVPTFYHLATPADEKDQRPVLRQEMPQLIAQTACSER